MTAVVLPAVQGTTPFGFLAGLGLLRLLAEERRVPCSLSWTADGMYQAVIDGPWSTVDEIAAELVAVAESIPAGSVLPGVADWPPPRPGKGPDPAVALDGPWLAMTGTPADRWRLGVAGLSGDLSPYVTRRGMQSIRSLFEAPLQAVRKRPKVILEGLTRGKRVRGCTAEQLDHHAYVSATDAQDGVSTGMGIPGLTWLAVMALPLLQTRLVGYRERVTVAPCWHPAPKGRLWMAYPLWSQPLGIHAVAAVLDHPLCNPNPEPDHAPRWEVDGAALRALNVFVVRGGHWTWVDKYARYLTPGPDPDPALRLNADGVAARLGIEATTWRSYVSRTQAPQPDSPEGVRPWWWSTTVDEYRAATPGQGARTDLKERA